MHRDIMEISSRYVYGGELEADESVAWRSLEELERDWNGEEGVVVRDRGCPLVWVDTLGAGFGESEEREEGGPIPAGMQASSRYNDGEAVLVGVVYRELREVLGLLAEDIGVISPYKAQVEKVRARLTASEAGGERCEVSTVDGFQGREKEVVVVSLVRSNPKKEVGFLSDVRRMNVAITRPRRLLIVVGDSGTVGADDFMKSIFLGISTKGSVVNVREVMGGGEEMAEDELRACLNTGAYKGVAQAKAKIEEGGKEEKKKKEGKKGKEEKKKGKEEKKEADIEEKSGQESRVEEMDEKRNGYGVEEEFYEEVKRVGKEGGEVKKYFKFDEATRKNVERMVKDVGNLEVSFSKKPACIHIYSTIECMDEEEQGGEEPAEQEPEKKERDPEEEKKEEEKKKKAREKKERQKEEKRKKKEEEDRLKNMDEDAFLEHMENERTKREEETNKHCCAMFGSTGKKCMKNIVVSGLVCKYCGVKYCVTHVYASMHGCEDEDERYEKEKFKSKWAGGESIGGGGDAQSEAGKAFLEAKLRRIRQEMEDKRKPKGAKEDKKEEKKDDKNKKKKK